MSGNYIFKLDVLEARGLGPELQALCASANFAEEGKATAYEVASDAFTFGTTLQWVVTKPKLRKMANSGTNTCKVTLLRKDGTKLGFVVLDLRTAKLQHEYKDKKGSGGDWLPLLSSVFPDKPPQIKLAYTFFQEGAAPDAPALADVAATIDEHLNKGSKEQPGPQAEADTAGLPDARQRPGSGRTAAAAAAAPPAGGLPDVEAGAVQGGAAPEGQPAALPVVMPGPLALHTPAPPPKQPEGPARKFSLTLDIRSFQASSKLPLNIASGFVHASLPPELLDLMAAGGAKLPNRLAPLKTYPAVDITRGMEAGLPNGLGAVTFNAGVMDLARVLARGGRVHAEVWHKDKFRADSLLGVASIPLSSLLQDCWVDGYAPVLALMARPAEGEGELAEEKVQVGLLRVIISLEEKGPAEEPVPKPPRVVPATPAGPLEAMRAFSSAAAGAGAGALAGEHPHTPMWGGHAQQGGPGGGMPPQADGAGGGGALPLAAAAAAAAAAAPVPFHELPEFRAAWELEVWKRNSEDAWREALKERESLRMATLENEWRRRERAREQDVATLRTEYAALEEKAKAVLSAVEERERKLVAAEESLARRRRDLEREHSLRMAEAEAAVRRLQAECEHQLELERDRTAEVVRLRAAAEERCAVAEGRAEGAEAALAALKEAHRGSVEAQLQRELMQAQEALRSTEGRLAKALKAKDSYKAQVVKLAEQLATVYKARQLEDAQFGWARGGSRAALAASGAELDNPALRGAADAQARWAAQQQEELGALRQQLLELKAAALSDVDGGMPSGQGAAGEAQLQPAAAAAQGGAPPQLLPAAPAASGSGEDAVAADGTAPAPDAATASGGAPVSSSAAAAVAAGGGGEAPAAGLPQQAQLAEIKRLLKRKTELLQTGAYTRQDALIVRIDTRIGELSAGAAGRQ